VFRDLLKLSWASSAAVVAWFRESFRESNAKTNIFNLATLYDVQCTIHCTLHVALIQEFYGVVGGFIQSIFIHLFILTEYS
jgi:hypothetical protein